MIRIAIVEDTASERDRLERYLNQYASEHRLEFDITAYADGIDIVSAYTPGIDILFLDIEMPVLDGIKTARLLREKDSRVVIVFVTNLAQYAIQGYEVDALDFIIKPMTWEVFTFRMGRILNRLEKKQSDGEQCIMVNYHDELRRVSIADLIYVEVVHHELTYHTVREAISLRATLRKAEDELKPHGFCRCNQCYLVNLRYVTRVEEDFVQVAQYRLSVSRGRKKELMAALSAYVVNH